MIYTAGSVFCWPAAFCPGIDKEKGTITVQAGARVSQILAELQKHGLTLENFSSITVPRSRSMFLRRAQSH